MNKAKVRSDWTIANPRLVEFYPESLAGGFSNIDGTLLFYARVNSLVSSSTTVLNLGAGRGSRLIDGTEPFKVHLENLKPIVAEMIGADVDPVIASNPGLHRYVMIKEDGSLPLDDGSIDLIICDWVVEHIGHPQSFMKEIDRVLRPGGWFCGRTTNRHGYISIASRLIPQKLHDIVLAKTQSERKKQDVFPAFYRMNTLAELKRLFSTDTWEHATSLHTPEPAYAGKSRLLWRLTLALHFILPKAMQPVLMIFIKKREFKE